MAQSPSHNCKEAWSPTLLHVTLAARHENEQLVSSALHARLMSSAVQRSQLLSPSKLSCILKSTPPSLRSSLSPLTQHRAVTEPLGEASNCCMTRADGQPWPNDSIRRLPPLPACDTVESENVRAPGACCKFHPARWFGVNVCVKLPLDRIGVESASTSRRRSGETLNRAVVGVGSARLIL